MLRITGIVLACLFFALPAQARQKTYEAHPMCGVLWPCEGVTTSARGERVVRAMRGFGTARKVYRPHRHHSARHVTRIAKTYRQRVRIAKVNYRHVIRRPAPKPLSVTRIVTAPITATVVAVSGIVTPLAAKIAEIQSSCGSRIISAVRHTRVAGTRIMSLHASGQAVDVAGNPSCIYSMLHGWAGGYSTDYGRVAHVHISWGGREHGVRFVHGGHRHARRYARHRYHRYASAR